MRSRILKQFNVNNKTSTTTVRSYFLLSTPKCLIYLSKCSYYLNFSHLSMLLFPESLSISFCRNVPSDVSPFTGRVRPTESTKATAPKRISVFIMTPFLYGKNKRNAPTLYHLVQIPGSFKFGTGIDVSKECLF